MIKEKDFFFLFFFYIYTIVFLVCPIFSLADIKSDKCYSLFFNEYDDLLSLMSYKQALKLIREINIKTKRDFFEFVLSKDKPEEFPVNPNKVYKEWTSWEDFLGVENAEIKKPPILEKKENSFDFESFKKVLNLALNSEETELKLSFQEKNFSVENFLQKERKQHLVKKRNFHKVRKNKNWMSYEEAKEFLQVQGIKTSTEFRKWRQSGLRPVNFPSKPSDIYKEKWKSWPDFLGTGTKVQEWLSYQSAKAFIQSEGVTSQNLYYKWRKEGHKPPNFPSNPDRFYKKEWKGWSDFLGTSKVKK